MSIWARCRRDDLGAAADAVFALAAPGVAGPVETDLGPALFAMNGILEAQEITLDQARDELSGEVAMDRARRMVAERSDGIEDQLAGGATLEEVAGTETMVLGSIDYSAGTEDGIAAYPAFRDVADKVTAEDFPTLVALDDGGVFALRLDGIDPARVRPFAEVRDAVLTAWTTAETHSRLVALGAEIKAQIDNGALLASTGLITTRLDAMTRDGFIDATPAAVIESAFGIEAPGKAAVVDAEGRVHVVTLDAVHAAARRQQRLHRREDRLREPARPVDRPGPFRGLHPRYRGRGRHHPQPGGARRGPCPDEPVGAPCP